MSDKLITLAKILCVIIHKAGHFQDFEFIQFFPFSKISPKLFPKTRARILQHFFPEMVTDIPYDVC
ncbi:TPA: hypothetical protein PBO32_005035 [Escherichia coli]|nr:hypothetical protein [Escherichia coli]